MRSITNEIMSNNTFDIIIKKSLKRIKEYTEKSESNEKMMHDIIEAINSFDVNYPSPDMSTIKASNVIARNVV